MSLSIQIKTELVEGEHDALLDFYKLYPKVFANKLLVRLCEGFMPIYKPNLSFFLPTPRAKDAKVRKITIKLDQVACPKFFEFYANLPHGSKGIVLVKLINHYAQLVEGDRTLLEKMYWSGGPLDSSLSAATSPELPQGLDSGGAVKVIANVTPPPETEANKLEAAAEVIDHVDRHDPLESFTVGL
jgi:hypothetical protein